MWKIQSCPFGGSVNYSLIHGYIHSALQNASLRSFTETGRHLWCSHDKVGLKCNKAGGEGIGMKTKSCFLAISQNTPLRYGVRETSSARRHHSHSKWYLSVSLTGTRPCLIKCNQEVRCQSRSWSFHTVRPSNNLIISLFERIGHNSMCGTWIYSDDSRSCAEFHKLNIWFDLTMKYFIVQ